MPFDPTRLSPLETRLEKFLAAEERSEERRREALKAYRESVNLVLDAVQGTNSLLEAFKIDVLARFKGLESRVDTLEGKGGPLMFRPRSMSPVGMAAVDPEKTIGGSLKVPPEQWAAIKDQQQESEVFMKAQAQQIQALQREAEAHRLNEALAKAKAEGAQELLAKQDTELEKARKRVSWWVPVLGFVFTVLATAVSWIFLVRGGK